VGWAWDVGPDLPDGEFKLGGCWWVHLPPPLPTYNRNWTQVDLPLRSPLGWTTTTPPISTHLPPLPTPTYPPPPPVNKHRHWWLTLPHTHPTPRTPHHPARTGGVSAWLRADGWFGNDRYIVGPTTSPGFDTPRVGAGRLCAKRYTGLDWYRWTPTLPHTGRGRAVSRGRVLTGSGRT